MEKKKAAAIEFGLKHASTLVMKLKRDLNSKSSENVSLKRFVLGLMTVEPCCSSFFDTLFRNNDQLVTRNRVLEKELERERTQKFQQVI